MQRQQLSAKLTALAAPICLSCLCQRLHGEHPTSSLYNKYGLLSLLEHNLLLQISKQESIVLVRSQ